MSVAEGAFVRVFESGFWADTIDPAVVPVVCGLVRVGKTSDVVAVSSRLRRCGQTAETSMLSEQLVRGGSISRLHQVRQQHPRDG